MKLKKLVVLLLTFSLLAAFTAGCGGNKPDENKEKAGGTEKPKLKIGWIYIGVPGDAGWTYAHDQARQAMEQELASEVTIESKILENVPEGADAERSIEQLAQDGCQIIIANSFGYGDALLEVAKKYPDIKFLHCSGLKTAENVSTYFGRMYQARYLSGIVAGKMTTNNTIGYVAAVPIPEVIRGINAFTLGAQSVNPDVKVKVVWTNTWFDPAKEKDAAKSLLEAGCDIIAQHQDTPSPQQAAQEAGKLSIGYNCDMSKFAPDAHLTSPIWNWKDYYVKTVRAVLDGTWKSESYWGGMEDGIVGLAPLSSKVPEDVVKLVEDKKNQIINKEWDVFTGPIKAQDGTLKVKEGQKLTDEEMLSMDWFVAGVEGTLQ